MDRDVYERRKSEMWRDVEKKQQVAREAHSELRRLELAWEEQQERTLRANYRLRPEHVRLLQHMRFEKIDGSDLASIGVSGKRPFGDSYPHSDIARILEWTLPNDDLSYEQEEEASRLMRELPLALNELIGRLDPNDY